MEKSSVEEIRARFDADVDRFSNLQTGQQAAVDASLTLELVADAAAAVAPHATDLLDVGCGAGNYTLKLLQRLPDRNATLIDLSRPMLDRAVERVQAVSSGAVAAMQGDIREIDLPAESFDIIVSGACLHHLREADEWRTVFTKLHRALRPGGCLWVCDLVRFSHEAVQQLMWRRYGQYLTGLKDEAYRDEVFAYIEQEDSPRPLPWLLDRLREAGFDPVEVLHLNTVMAAYGGIRPRELARQPPDG